MPWRRCSRGGDVTQRPKLPEAIYRACLFVLPFACAFLYVVSLLPIVSGDAWRVIGAKTYGVGITAAKEETKYAALLKEKCK